MIFMPFYAEQAHNAQMGVALRFGPIINKYTVNAKILYSTINTVLQNKDYDHQNRANQIYNIYTDRIIPTMDEAIFFSERLLRIPQGRRINFVRRGMDLTWPEFLIPIHMLN